MKVLVTFVPKDITKCNQFHLYVYVPAGATDTDVDQAAFDWFAQQFRRDNWRQSITAKGAMEPCDIADYDVEIEQSLGFTE